MYLLPHIQHTKGFAPDLDQTHLGLNIMWPPGIKALHVYISILGVTTLINSRAVVWTSDKMSVKLSLLQLMPSSWVGLHAPQFSASTAQHVWSCLVGVKYTAYKYCYSSLTLVFLEYGRSKWITFLKGLKLFILFIYLIYTPPIWSERPL